FTFGGSASGGHVRSVGTTTSSTRPAGTVGSVSAPAPPFEGTPFGAPDAIHCLISAILTAGSDSPPLGIRFKVSAVSIRLTISLSWGLPAITDGRGGLPGSVTPRSTESYVSRARPPERAA